MGYVEMTTVPSSPSSTFHPAPHPPIFTVPRALSPLTIDGNVLSKPSWKEVPWSEPFQDIRGTEWAPEEDTPVYHGCRTRVKMLWDDDYLYIGALLEYGYDEPSNRTTEGDVVVSEIRATYTERNSPIFHEDSDFEVFLDPTSGSCHSYGELEANALNTVWNLRLDKPYADGGQEHSGRVAKENSSDPFYYEVRNQRTAVRIVQGAVNDPTPGVSRAWTLEAALAHSDTFAGVPPHVGRNRHHHPPLWRINFSRVEWKGRINWTWAPQIAWNPQDRKWNGVVDMHRPESWGYAKFVLREGTQKQESVSNDDDDDSLWPLRSAVVLLYYELHHYAKARGSFTDQLNDLGFPTNYWPSTMDINIKLVGNDGFCVIASSLTNDQRIWVSITNDRFMQSSYDSDSDHFLTSM